MLRRHSSVDEPTPLMKTRRFLIPHLMYPKAPMISEWLEVVHDPFPLKPTTGSPPTFYRGYGSLRSINSDISSADIFSAPANPQKTPVTGPVVTCADIFAHIIRPVFFDGPGRTESMSSNAYGTARSKSVLSSALRAQKTRRRTIIAVTLGGVAFAAGLVCRGLLVKPFQLVVAPVL